MSYLLNFQIVFGIWVLFYGESVFQAYKGVINSCIPQSASLKN